jgi:predicted nucleotidyltransferase
MKKVNELKKILQDHKATLKDEYGVIEIGLFGSYTKVKKGTRVKC